MSGKHGNHDTVIVFFQTADPDAPPSRKERVSEMTPFHHQPIDTVLECQKLCPYQYNKKVNKTDPLPSNLISSPNPQYEDDSREAILSLVRNASFSSSVDQLDMVTWVGGHALTSERSSPLKKVGFAPIIPHPVTNHETVYTVLKNLSSLCDTMTQKTLPVVVDEGVFHYVVDIYCHTPDLFYNLFPMLGMFHMAKAAMRCAGKYLKGFGFEDGLVENDIFGTKIVEQVFWRQPLLQVLCWIMCD